MNETILLCTLWLEVGLAVGGLHAAMTRWIREGRATVMAMLDAYMPYEYER